MPHMNGGAFNPNSLMNIARRRAVYILHGFSLPKGKFTGWLNPAD